MKILCKILILLLIIFSYIQASADSIYLRNPSGATVYYQLMIFKNPIDWSNWGDDYSTGGILPLPAHATFTSPLSWDIHLAIVYYKKMVGGAFKRICSSGVIESNYDTHKYNPYPARPAAWKNEPSCLYLRHGQIDDNYLWIEYSAPTTFNASELVGVSYPDGVVVNAGNESPSKISISSGDYHFPAGKQDISRDLLNQVKQYGNDLNHNTLVSLIGAYDLTVNTRDTSGNIRNTHIMVSKSLQDCYFGRYHDYQTGKQMPVWGNTIYRITINHCSNSKGTSCFSDYMPITICANIPQFIKLEIKPVISGILLPVTINVSSLDAPSRQIPHVIVTSKQAMFPLI